MTYLTQTHAGVEFLSLTSVMLLGCFIIYTEQVANLIQPWAIGQLTKLEHTHTYFNARHSSALARKISADYMSGLEPVVFLAKGARVILINHEFVVQHWPL